MQILKCYVINPKHMPINVLPEEEGQIFPYEKTPYLEWNGDYYVIRRSM
ncbi:MAG TPA: hypothetical protein O0X35_05960 [Methanocorpusculum sp.]|nr:hypothetical protein [Methanocorpusculum sp.]